MKNSLLFVLLGLIIGFLLAERKSQPLSRSLAQMSKAYAENHHPLKELHVIPDEKLQSYANNIASELIQPGLTELEAKLVADYMEKTIMDATAYYSHRELLKDQQSEDWLYQIMEDTSNEPNDER
jgi:Skp family chaperone for outer membrane proteins